MHRILSYPYRERLISWWLISKAAPLVESFGVHNLPLGGENGYVGVRKCRKGFQGYTPKKRHTTAEKETAQEAT